MAAEIDVLKAQIVRQDVSQPWGFRLQGGADVGQPLSITRITPGSPAARIGLRPGDEVAEIHSTSTAHLTYQQAMDYIGQYGDSIILTIERKARGPVPSTHPEVLQYQDNYDRPKDYQPLDMTGAAIRPGHTLHRPPPATSTTLNSYDNGGNDYIAQARPFEEPAGRRSHNYQPPSQSSAHVHEQQKSDRAQQLERYHAHYLSQFDAPLSNPSTPPYHPVAYNAPSSPPHHPQAYNTPSTPPYHPVVYNAPGPSSPPHHPRDPPTFNNYSSPLDNGDDWRGGGGGAHPQSRTFRLLQSVMQNDELGSGAAALPPPRSASLEQMKREQGGGGGGGGGGGRVKVFMPQQYNSPLGMYSADNLLETFAVQAETMLDTMESRRQYEEEHHPVFGSNGLLP